MIYLHVDNIYAQMRENDVGFAEHSIITNKSAALICGLLEKIWCKWSELNFNQPQNITELMINVP